MADTFDLTDLLGKASQYQAAKYGTGGLMDLLGPMYQAIAPNAPAAKLLNTFVQTRNLGNYNKAVQNAQMTQLLRQAAMDKNNAAIQNRRTGMDISGPFDIALANSAAPDIRKDNGRPAINTILGGGALNIPENADVDPEFIRQYVAQQNKAVNFANQGTGLGSISAGQGQSALHNGLMQFLQSKGTQMLQPQNGQMDNGQPGLQAGANITGPSRGIDLNVSPYLYQTDIPPQVSSLMSAGLRDSQTAAQQGEAGRHNRVEEGIGQTNAKAHMISANKPPGGGNPYQGPQFAMQALKFQLDSLNDQEQNLTSWAKRNKVIDEKGQINYASPNAGTFLSGMHGVNEQRKKIYGGAPFGSTGGPAFGNQGKGKLDSTGSRLTGTKAAQSNDIYPGRG